MANRSYNPTTRQERSDEGNSMAYRGCVSKSLQVTGILHIVAGALCIVFGISAIVLKAFASYVAIPIWSGLLLFMITGTIGVANYCKPKSTAIVTAYIVMSTISATFSFLMIVTYSIFIQEEGRNAWIGFICEPLSRVGCGSPFWSRIVINGLLILIYLLEMGCGVTSFALALYKKCPCCRHGCKLCKENPGNSNMVYYAANMGGMPMMAMPNNQCARPIYIPDGSSGTPSQPAQFMYLAPSPQSYVAMPAGTQQNQTIPTLPPPPQQQPTPQAIGMAQQSSGDKPGQASFVLAQAPGQMQPQMLAQPQPASQSQPAGQQSSGLPTGFVLAQTPGQMQPQGVAQPQPASHSQPAGQQSSGLPTGQTGFIQPQLVLQPAGAAQQPMATPPGQMGFFQVQGPGGQIQMIPASAVYPQVMMVPGPQQLGPIPQPGPTPQPGTTHQSGATQQPESAQQSGPSQMPEPAQQQVEQSTVTAPSKPIEDHSTDKVPEPNEEPSGQVSSGQFSDQAALI